MSAPRYAVNQFDEIGKHLKGIEAQTTERINSTPLDEPKPVEAPADIDWTGMYGYPCANKVTFEPAQIGIMAHIDFITSFHNFGPELK
jgi:hypothetical protein